VRGGAVSAARCRRTVARDNNNAAQTAEVKPLPVGNAIATATMICRCALPSASSRPEVPPLFLYGNDGFRLIQTVPQGCHLSYD
jgi:hypothetical protein